ncbi:hypothetical protein BhaS171_00041 [Bacillus phage vB_BhaS-171]|uniref:hypothetical protein n=1 Tax=Bacillus phage vB_BhaS-171 TaxID=1775140 RepID=UPI000744C976|nr:hypothetical protein BH781_gp41 [Bacillus phage vB_BhaS-171]ALY08097.1 hypothetical protein BhaS171_00041 [Bacillus phage vB_BhaS-171]
MCQQCESPEVNETIIDRIDDIEIPIVVCTDCFKQFNAECDAEEKAWEEKLKMAKKIVAMMELGADIHIRFYEVDHQKAEMFSGNLHEIIDKSYVKYEYEEYDSYTTSISERDGLSISIFTEDYKSESHEHSA